MKASSATQGFHPADFDYIADYFPSWYYLASVCPLDSLLDAGQ